MTKKGEQGLIALVVIFIVFAFAYFFLTPKEGPQVQIGDTPTNIEPEENFDDINQEFENQSNAISAAVANLSEQTKVAPEDVAVSLVEPQEFSDASLDCPVEGETYAQVITPGYKILLSAQEEEYDYRVTTDVSVVKLCTQ